MLTTYLHTYLLNLWSRVLLEKQSSSLLVKKSINFMEHEGSLLHSHVPITCPVLSQLDPVHAPTSQFLKIHLNIIPPLMPWSSQWSHSLRFPHENPVYASPLPIRATCPAHLILNLIARTILGEEYRSLSSSLCNFLHSLLPCPS